MASRRTFILGTLAAGGALVVGWAAMPPRQRLSTAKPLAAAAGQAVLNGWVKVAQDGRVTVMTPKSEMGQGVHTALAMLVAEEMDVPMAQVAVEQAPVDGIYNNLATVVDGLPFHPDDDGAIKRAVGHVTARAMREIGVMVTGGSSSVKDLWLPMRQAGASARDALVRAAAAQWKVAPAECRTEGGFVLHANGQRLAYGALASAAAALPLAADAPLKDAKAFKLIGQPTLRLEGASKSDGTARFAIDAKPEQLLYASILPCPTRGGTVLKLDDVAALKVPGVKKVVRVPALNGASEAVAVVADHPWRAMKGVKALNVEWDHGTFAAFSTREAYEKMGQALDKTEGFGYYSKGDVQSALKGAAKTIKAEYRAPYLAHSQMEPNNCTVKVEPQAATVWAPTQVPDVARSAVAKVLGLKDEQVNVQVQLLGGGFGRRLDVDFIAQAAAVAQAMPGLPVQTLWSREQDMKSDFYRPACLSRFTAGLDANNRLVAWNNASAGQAIVPQVLKRAFGLPGAGPDKTASEGAFDQPYEWPNARVGHEIIELPVPIGFWRSVGHSHQAFFKEGFMDEVAAAAGQDPVAFRLGMLTTPQHARAQAVLKLAAEKAGWGQANTPAPDGAKTARGVALHRSFGTLVAQVVEVSLSPEKAIRVHRVVCAIDCGLAVNPNHIRAQVESSVVFALSAALYGEVGFEKGQPQVSNFHDQPVLRMNECPVIETHILPSAEHPEGVGEPAVPPLAPAVANAVFALTGQRLRNLPLKLAV